MAYSLPFGGGIWDVGVIDQESDRPQTSKALDKVKPIKSKTATTTSKVSTDTQLMTSTQSLNVVKTLIQTGIGVITYLRGIFPEECFNDDKIGPDRSESSTGDDAILPRSDKVLDYLDEGAMDAIQRGYLRQLLFAMYLDPESLETSLNATPSTLPTPKLNMLHPKLVRYTWPTFLTFKLHYNDHTPSDYEPPHFTAGSAELDRFTFGTSGVEEVPSATEMGKLILDITGFE
ncbi:hypothetical protein KEM48_012925 [Puccinia striiformis f. sp. tritici PST-130]|nr:hypothetical protein KEM48_012925 [Puccinia striiformis f. sp. tritici PST-130]